MISKKFKLALESISFQDEKFIQEIAAAFEVVRDKYSDSIVSGVLQQSLYSKLVGSWKSKMDQLYASEEVKAISDMALKRLGVRTKIVMAYNGPAIEVPRINNSHPFTAHIKEIKDSILDTRQDFFEVHVLKYLDGQKEAHGKIDLKNAKLSGVFSEQVYNLYIPLEFFYSCSEFTAMECAAITLHEFGHVFTFCEYASRAVTTNLNLAWLTRSMDQSVSDQTRGVLFKKYAGTIGAKDQKKVVDTLKKVKSPSEMSVIVLGLEVEATKSELGFSPYDTNSSEYIADQFSARFGGAVPLATGLDKIFKKYGAKAGNEIYVEIFFWLYSLLTLLILPTMMILLMDRHYIYDNPAARLKRIRQQLVEQLKDSKISDEVRKKLTDDIDSVDKILGSYNEYRYSFEKLAGFFRKSYQDSLDQEDLQKQLEGFAYNDLFVGANRLIQSSKSTSS